jgi:GNAT superfamily N-acetyltransferase
MQICVLSKAQLLELISYLQQDSPIIKTLFSPIRVACIDETIVAKINEEIVGVCSISLRSSEDIDHSRLEVLYVKQEFRRKGVGKRLVCAAIDRCRERKPVFPIRAEATSRPAAILLKKFPMDYQSDLAIIDGSSEISDIIFLM